MKVEDWQEVMTQLEAFAKPFPETLVESALRRHWVEYVSGLLSTLKRETDEGVADLHGQDRKRCRAAGLPKPVKSQTRHVPALDRLDESGP